jgi:hypothetical protein
MYVPAQFNTSAIEISGPYSVYRPKNYHRKDVTYFAGRRMTSLVLHKGQNVIRLSHSAETRSL